MANITVNKNLERALVWVDRIEEMLFVDCMQPREIAAHTGLSLQQIKSIKRAIANKAKSSMPEEWGDSNRVGALIVSSTLARIKDLRSRLATTKSHWEAKELHKETRENYAFLLKCLQDLGIAYKAPIKLDGEITLAHLLGAAPIPGELANAEPIDLSEVGLADLLELPPSAPADPGPAATPPGGGGGAQAGGPNGEPGRAERSSR